LGLLLGTPIGATLGSGASFLEGLAAMGLGLLAGGVAAAIPLGIGAAAGDPGWGAALGSGFGSLAYVFLTPIFTTLFAGGPATEPTAVTPGLVPVRGGAGLAVAGSF
ncbi:MAG TPA: hypothetical protein RMH99_07850, partial [Sandaracinaceae bacterium LLY-WYZ-13_1]|nr:hypothetical protein [Sandaracinaceae bacterium LLY-WYZ-13_1]